MSSGWYSVQSPLNTRAKALCRNIFLVCNLIFWSAIRCVVDEDLASIASKIGTLINFLEAFTLYPNLFHVRPSAHQDILQDDELHTSPFSAVAHLPVEKVQPSIVPEHKAVVSEHTQALCPDLPDDIVPLILGHCDSESLRAAHMVNATWQIAAREQVTLLAPPTVSAKHLDRFPSVSPALLPFFCHHSDA